MSFENVFIHPTAIVSPDAKIGKGTRIGAYSIIDEDVKIGENSNLREHVVVRKHTEIGQAAQVFSFAVVGESPQHLKYNDEPTRTIIGDRVTLRESSTIHRGTSFGNGETRIGNDTYVMAYSHVAHDCVIGNNVILANSNQLAGHVEVGDHTIVGGQSAVAQHCRIGKFCYIGGGSIIRKDLPPFLLGKGNIFEVQGINTVGLTRQGFSSSSVSLLRKAFRIFYLQNLTVSQAMEKIISELGEVDEVKTFLDFIKSSKIGFIR